MIDEIYRELKEMHLCRSGNRFSLDWLHMNESYYRTLKAKNLTPSVKVIARCGMKLRSTAMYLAASEHDVIRSRSQRLNELGQQCIDEALKLSVY